MHLIARTLVVLLAATLAFAQAQAPGPDTLVIAQSVDADSMDPAQISSRPAANIAAHIWGSLLETTSDGDIVPYLAESFEYSEDGTALDFTLRPGLTCHDGEALTAEDVAYSFNRAADPDNGFTGNTPGFIFSSMGFIDAAAVDELTVRINTTQYNPIVPGLVGEVYIHCEGSYENMTLDEAAENPVGSGPYAFREWIKDDRMVLERVEGFDLRDAGFETLVWRVVPEASTRAAELIAGNVDIVANVLPDQQDAVDASENAEVIPVAGTRRIYVGFNFKDKFAQTEGGAAIQETIVRQAMNHAVDVESIVENVLNGFGSITGQPTLEGHVGHNPDVEPYPYDPDEAERLVEESGHAGVEITLQTPIGRYLGDVEIAQAAANQIDSLSNVSCELEQREFSSLVQDITTGNIEDKPHFNLLGWGNGEFDGSQTITPLMTSDGALTIMENEELDGLIADAEATQDPDERVDILQEANELAHDLAPWVFLHQQFSVYGVSSDISWEPRSDEFIDPDTATQQ